MRRAVGIASILVMIALGAAQAGDGPDWRAWVQMGTRLVMVDADGETLNAVDLPLDAGYGLRDTQVAVSPNGRLVAYLTYAPDHPEQFRVYDTEKRELILSYDVVIDGDLWGTTLFLPGEGLFNELETAAAFGYTVFDPDSVTSVWEIVVFNLSSGAIEYRLRQDSPEMAAIGMPNYFYTPILRQFNGMAITFTLEILENEGNPAGFTWTLADQGVRANIAYPTLLSDTLTPTGEVVSIMGDSRLPSGEGEPSFFRNSVQVYDPAIGGRFPVYSTLAGGWPTEVRFVQSGARLLLRTTTQDGERWVLVERNGTVADEWDVAAAIQVSDLRGTPDGFVYTMRLTTAGGMTGTIPAAFAVNTRDGLDSGEVVWQMDAAEFAQVTNGANMPLEIAWIECEMLVGPFMPWRPLAEPVYAAAAPPTPVTMLPTPIPQPTPVFRTGMTVRVQTTGGEILNLRDAPTRGGAVLRYLEDDLPLALLEGPIEAEGYVWWRVRTPDGLEGWAVENNGEMQTLFPV